MIVPCLRGRDFDEKAEEIALLLKERAHEIAGAGLSENDFYELGYFRAAIEKIRGQYAAKLREKRGFMRVVLNHMQDSGIVLDWRHSGHKDRHDYEIDLIGGGTAVIEQKGCLDGNNVTISERPPNAEEFYIWSICTNQGSDIGKGVRSALMRLTAEMIATDKKVDGMIVWDMLCGQSGRPCPKLNFDRTRTTRIAEFELPPPCIYLFPATIGHSRVNPNPGRRSPASLKFITALMQAFRTDGQDINFVDYEVRKAEASTQRRITVTRAGTVQHQGGWASVKRI